jgi:hypothetical protein
MAFFDSLPKPPPPEPPLRPVQHPWQQPDNVIPGIVAAGLLMVRTESAAVALGSLRCYPRGFAFSLHVRVRQLEEGMHLLADPFGRHRRFRGETPAEQLLRLGIEYADGRRTATNAAHPRFTDDFPADQLLLQEGSSGSSDRRWDGNFWAYPLPPDGPVTFVASWQARGVTESRVEVDGAGIRAAAGRAVVLWPDDPEEATPGRVVAG